MSVSIQAHPSAIGRARTAALPELRAALVQQRRFRVDQLADLAGGAPAATHPSTAEPGFQVTLLLRAAASMALADIDAALSRMHDGSYGWCTSCDSAIDLERLEALPMVAMCMPCQREQEER